MADPPQAPALALLLTVFNSIFEVFLLCFAGYILAGQGILDKRAQKQINHLNVSLFTPCLLFSKVAFFLSPQKLRELWIMPIFFVVVTLVSMLVAYLFSSFLGLKKSQRNFAIAASMFMNSNSLPIALMQSLVVSVPTLKWGEDDNTDAMVGRALSYLVLFSTLGMVLRWSYGVKLLSQADEEVKPQPLPVLVEVSHDTPPLSQIAHPSTSTFVAEPEDYLTSYPYDPTPPKPRPSKRHTTYYRSFPNSPDQEEVALPAASDSSDVDSLTGLPQSPQSPYVGSSYGSEEALPLHSTPSPSSPVPHSPPHHPELSYTQQSEHPAPGLGLDTCIHHMHRHRTTMRHRILQSTRRGFAAFNNFMTAPLWAAVLSIIVALVQPIQHALEDHILAVKGAINSAGKCSIPLTLVVLGAYFYVPQSDEDITARAGISWWKARWWDVRECFGIKSGQPIMLPEDDDQSMMNGLGVDRLGDERKGREGETKTVIVAVLSRMVITPLVLMPLLALSAKFNWHNVFEDPVFVVSNVLLLSSPPAVTLAQITQAASGDAFERLISRTIFWSYCVVTPPATIIYVVLGLLLSKI
ncbi:hypothetical protein H0H92_005655 [Tricholoma furcatifolium]|nr:hypothetical protein H0H92_005655 [Tricholoma furcatifolium]